MKEIRIPKVGMSTVDVEIVEINVVVGSLVEPTTIVMSVAGDKVDLDIEAECAGTVTEILCGLDDVVDVGKVVVLVDES